MRIDGVLFDCGSSMEDSQGFVAQLDAHGIPYAVVEGPRQYEDACVSLGIPAASTWVIANKLFSLEAARSAGFATICVMDDSDAPQQAALERASDILVHGFRELSVALVEDYARPRQGSTLAGELRALIVNGSPEPSSAGLVRALADDADYVIAADRGAEALRAAGVTPDVFCGDADSVSPEVASWARQWASTDILYPSEKYESDLGLAVACARHEAARRGRHLALTLTCTSGGRPDHALTVMGSLVKAADARPRVVEDGFECRILTPKARDSWTIAGCVGRTFSVVSLERGTIVSEVGSKWELDHRPVDFLGGWGQTLSNEVAADPCVISCNAGLAAVFLIR